MSTTDRTAETTSATQTTDTVIALLVAEGYDRGDVLAVMDSIAAAGYELPYDDETDTQPLSDDDLAVIHLQLDLWAAQR